MTLLSRDSPPDSSPFSAVLLSSLASAFAQLVIYTEEQSFTFVFPELPPLHFLFLLFMFYLPGSRVPAPFGWLLNSLLQLRQGSKSCWSCEMLCVSAGWCKLGVPPFPLGMTLSCMIKTPPKKYCSCSSFFALLQEVYEQRGQMRPWGPCFGQLHAQHLWRGGTRWQQVTGVGRGCSTRGEPGWPRCSCTRCTLSSRAPGPPQTPRHRLWVPLEPVWSLVLAARPGWAGSWGRVCSVEEAIRCQQADLRCCPNLFL